MQHANRHRRLCGPDEPACLRRSGCHQTGAQCRVDTRPARGCLCLPRRVGTGQRGFTLLEVLVAMALVGFGFAMAFVAMSGANRLTEKAFAHEAAMLLAQAKLDEVLANPTFALSQDVQQDRYAGALYGYRVQATPIELARAPALEAVELPFVLEEISVEVFWGPPGQQQSFRLGTQRIRRKPAAAAARTS